jgi:hypothetical protein
MSDNSPRLGYIAIALQTIVLLLALGAVYGKIDIEITHLKGQSELTRIQLDIIQKDLNAMKTNVALLELRISTVNLNGGQNAQGRSR